MRDVKRILFPTDFSEAASAALPHAARLAKGLGAQLHLFHATVLHDYHPLEGEGDFPDSRTLHDALSQRSRDLLAKLALERPEELDVVEAEDRGTAAGPLILDYADQNQIDLIVMATHGRRGFQRFWFGSVAEAVVRHAECPVLTVRSGADSRATSEGAKILVPIDFSDSALEALAYARRLSGLFDAELHLFHVIEQPMQPIFYEAYTEIQPPSSEELAKTAHRELQGLVTKSGIDPRRVTSHVSSGFAANEILRFAEDEKCDLIIIGSQGLTGLAHFLLGSVAEKVVRQAACPVLTVKRPITAEQREAATG